MKKAISYYRVSTKRQGHSGLGLDAQKKSVQNFVAVKGFEIVCEFIEVESSRKDKRPFLHQALIACAEHGAVLIIAKLDRLSRNVAFISALQRSKVEFIAVDMPYADKLLIHIMAAFAEYECDQISKRTKEALQAAKRKGRMLGEYGRQVLSTLNKKNADAFALKMLPEFERLKQGGHTTIRSLTHELNRQKVKTFSGGAAKWHTQTVHSLIKRMEKLNRNQV